ncbi:hypothetical protein ABIB26_001785 [Arthrobacter sp. UYEF20]
MATALTWHTRLAPNKGHFDTKRRADVGLPDP